MSDKRADRVREQVVVYLGSRDRELLDEMTERTGLTSTELFRRGLRRLADELLSEKKPGSSLAHLIATASDDGLPGDVAEHHDEYLSRGGYSTKRGRSR